MSRLVESLGPNDHVLGKANAPVTLVEYGDYECPFCGRAEGEVEETLRRVGSEVVYAFRHFPLTELHPHALLAAQAAEAADAQGRFWEMHRMLFENQEALEPEHLLLYAEALQLDVERFAADLRESEHLPRIEHVTETGTQSGVRGTPTFFVDGFILRERGWDADSLTAAIRSAREGERLEEPAR